MKRNWLETNLRAAWARAYVRIVGINRDLSWIFWEGVLPILSVAAYVFIYKALGAPEEYVGFVVLGGVMTAFWMNVLWAMAANWFFEKHGGNLEIYFQSPTHPAAILLGMAVGGIFATTLRAVILLVLGSWLFDVRFGTANLGLAFLAFGITLIALYGLGMMFASLYLLYGREAYHLSNMLQEPVFLLSGFYFPVKSLNFYVAAFGSLIPLTLGMDAVRQLVFGSELGWLPVPLELGLLTGLGILFLWGALWALKLMERLAKREGRLTLRWQ